jgi:hypothetical protein
MSIGLLGAFGPMLSAMLAIFQIKSSCGRFCISLPLSLALDERRLSLNLDLLVASDLS